MHLVNTYYVYVLLCADRSYYTGVTNNLERRVGEHEYGHDEECYTYKRRPVELVYSADFKSIIDAIDWEKHFKRWSRAKKTAFISGNFSLVSKLARCRNKTGKRS